MSSEVQLRIRYPDGASQVNTFPETSTISELKQQILSVVKVKPQQIVLRTGYPPTPLSYPDHTSLSEAEISSGDTLIVEIHEDDEPQIEKKPTKPENVQNQTIHSSGSAVRIPDKFPISSNQSSQSASMRYATDEAMFDSGSDQEQKLQGRKTGINQKKPESSNNNARQNASTGRGGQGGHSQQNNQRNTSGELMSNEMDSFRNKVSSGSNANYKNGGSGAGDRDRGGNPHGATNLSKGRSREFVARMPSHHENSNGSVIDLTEEDVNNCALSCFNIFVGI